jgi:CPA1 family monovalent cation:H+ antiporter
MTVMSGESLINDATSLTLVRVFAAIVAGATVTVWDGVIEFLLAVIVGVAVGLVFGIVLHQLRLRISDPVVTGTFGLLVPFGAYAVAEFLHGSGVLAVVAMGLYVGFNAPRTNYTTRQQDGPLWSSMDFLLESFVFAYIGLQLPHIVSDLSDGDGTRTILLSLAVFAVVLLVRPVFVYASYAWGQFWQRLRLRRWKRAVESYQRNPESGRARAMRERKDKLAAAGRPLTKQAITQRLVEPALTVRERAVVSLAGMRGGSARPHREHDAGGQRRGARRVRLRRDRRHPAAAGAHPRAAHRRARHRFREGTARRRAPARRDPQAQRRGRPGVPAPETG